MVAVTSVYRIRSQAALLFLTLQVTTTIRCTPGPTRCYNAIVTPGPTRCYKIYNGVTTVLQRVHTARARGGAYKKKENIYI